MHLLIVQLRLTLKAPWEIMLDDIPVFFFPRKLRLKICIVFLVDESYKILSISYFLGEIEKNNLECEALFSWKSRKKKKN